MGGPESHTPPGPDPSTLRSVEHVSKGINPIPLRVTYTSNRISDYIAFKRDGWQLRLELAGPLFSIVRKAEKISDLTAELSAALSSIGVAGIEERFREAVAEYANAVFSVSAFTASISLGVAVYLLKKLYDAERLVFGFIHQASIEELSRWMGLIEEAKNNQTLRSPDSITLRNTIRVW